jgi:hypothetical protein
MTMNGLDACQPKVTTAHQAKLAYVYVRQSSTQARSRAMARARSCNTGWWTARWPQVSPRERVQIIDDDLGKSGASAEQRLGFRAN